jgi:HK97 family phage major capsid protein
MRLQEIEARLNVIKGEIEAEGADLTALENEVKELREERKGILEQAEQRKKISEEVANLSNAQVIKEFGMEEKSMNFGVDTVEYRSAFLKKLLGKELSEVEQRSIASTNVAGAIPTITANTIMNKIKQIAPLLNEVTLLHVAGNLTYAIEGTNNDAALHTENALINAADDTLVYVKLGGYEINKLVRISATVRTMTIDAFEGWLADLIAENIARKIEYYLIYGTGSSQPEGIDYAQSWTDGTNAVDWATDNKPLYAELCELISYLPGGYYTNAKWLMNHKTFWSHVQAIRDDGKAPIVSNDGGTYRIMGKKVLFSDFVADGDIFLGDFRKVVANLSQDISVKSSEHSGFAYNSVDYLGGCIFDSKVAIGDAFVKGASTLTVGI